MKKSSNPMRKALEALSKHPKCGAHCRTTGESCKSPSMANGRCRMHGGKSTGRPITHGRTTKKSMDGRREIKRILQILNKKLM